MSQWKVGQFLGKLNIPQIWSDSQMFWLWITTTLMHPCFSVLRSEQGLREHDRRSRGSTNASELLPAAPPGPHSCLQPAWTQPHKCKCSITSAMLSSDSPAHRIKEENLIHHSFPLTPYACSVPKFSCAGFPLTLKHGLRPCCQGGHVWLILSAHKQFPLKAECRPWILYMITTACKRIAFSVWPGKINGSKSNFAIIKFS